MEGNEATQEETQAGASENGQTLKGIFVFIRENEMGRQVGYNCLGGFDEMSAPVVLELATKAARLHVGLEHG